MIARTWRGRTRAGDADGYVDYLYRTGMDAHRKTVDGRYLVERQTYTLHYEVVADGQA
ncbi:hypothetical protein [Nonomuraea sp. NPDC049709]|uniref:hypothetical protein n=1 Tax=Nonomuraea sp. NPDC049709 TaxID=3154736 RepID=UPI003438D2CA